LLADVSTHLDWLKGVCRRKVAVLTIGGGHVSTLLSVESGLMQGVCEGFEADTLSVGAANDCDIVLMDSGILPHHLTLHMRRSAFGVLVEVSTLGPVTIGKINLGANHASGFLRLPQTLTVGTVKMTLAQAQAQVPKDLLRNTHPPRLMGMVAIVSFVLALALMVPLAQFLRSPERRPVRIAHEQAATSAAPLAFDRTFRKSVETELARLQLNENVDVAGAEGLLTINGRIPAAKWSAWRSFTHWYDQQANAPVLVQDVSLANELASLKPVAAIRLSDPAEILFVDGDIRKVGELVDDDWVIASISAAGIVLTRGEDRTEITF
jgi:hypothetical protein